MIKDYSTTTIVFGSKGRVFKIYFWGLFVLFRAERVTVTILVVVLIPDALIVTTSVSAAPAAPTVTYIPSARPGDPTSKKEYLIFNIYLFVILFIHPLHRTSR